MTMISKFLLISTKFRVIICFLTRLLTLGILFLTAVNTDFVAKPLTSGILFSHSVSFVFLTRSIAPGILFSNSDLSV